MGLVLVTFWGIFKNSISEGLPALTLLSVLGGQFSGQFSSWKDLKRLNQEQNDGLVHRTWLTWFLKSIFKEGVAFYKNSVTYFSIQAYLRNTGDSVPDHCNKVNVAVQWVKWLFWFPGVYKKLHYFYIFTFYILHWQCSVTALCFKKRNAHALICDY